MKTLILAAGYATRLWPLTKNRAKPLLSVGGKPMIEHIMEALERVDEVDRVYVVTNAKFAGDFADWAKGYRGSKPVTVVNDETVSDDDKLGAIGDIDFVIRKAPIDDDLFVINGDNLFDLDLVDLVRFYHEKGTTIVGYDVGTKEAARLYGIISLDENQRVLSFVEKPEDPPSTLAAIGIYLYPREKLPLVRRYLEEGGNPDAPGNLVKWLYTFDPVYAYRFTGRWYDIGDFESLEEADKDFSREQK